VRYGQNVEVIIGRVTTVEIFSASVEAILHYTSEYWTVTERTLDGPQVGLSLFISKCLRGILNKLSTGQTEYPAKHCSRKLVKDRCYSSWEENGTGLDYTDDSDILRLLVYWTNGLWSLKPFHIGQTQTIKQSVFKSHLNRKYRP